METQKIQHADILDILFDGRNKDYGAYQLRKTYNRRLAKALGATASVCLLLIGGYTLAGRGHAVKAAIPVGPDIEISSLKKEEAVIPPPVKVVTPPVAQIRNTIPRIVPADQVKPEDVPPPVDTLENARIGTANIKGDAFDGTVGPPVAANGNGAGIIEQPKAQDDDGIIFNKVEIESNYPDGMEAWRRFLSKNFRVPDEAINNNAGGTVVVQFVVDKEGNVSDVNAISGPKELWAEAVRVIKKSGRWTPAVQNGRHVASYKRQPIVVTLSEE
jgi:protein TonB